MKITERYFVLGDQWCVIHLPERPNGFGVLLIGDIHHYVDSKTTFWLEHMGRQMLLEDLREEGYTIFSSHLYGKHYGSDSAVELADRLYHQVLKKETLNRKIHIVAEGTGGLVALELMNKMPDFIRSVVMIDPVLDVQEMLQNEKKHKFFYKRLVKDLMSAYTLEEELLPEIMSRKSYKGELSRVPVQLLLSSHSKKEQEESCRTYEKERKEREAPIDFVFYLQERKYESSNVILHFFEQYEKEL